MADSKPKNMKIEDCDLSARVKILLKKKKVMDTDQLAVRYDEIIEDKKIRAWSEREIKRVLQELGYIKEIISKSGNDNDEDEEISDEELEKRFDELFVKLDDENDAGSHAADSEDTDDSKKDSGESDSEIELFELDNKVISIKDFPDYVKEVVRKEYKDADLFSGIELGKIRRYLDWILNFPWVREQSPELDLHAAKMVLDKNHYGLEDVKEKILEFMAVQKLTGDSYGTVLLLVGPPGVGKTSIAKSIAEAMNRKFVKVSLGGAFDEMLVRGCDRSYSGSQPGDIIRAIRRIGTLAPVMLLDEIDKIGKRSTVGDISSALLELLDSDRSRFVDHYFGIPIDMSGVVFIATANSLQQISPVLLDRMQVIEVDGYTIDEKLSITREFILPKEETRHGLVRGFIQMDENTLLELVQNYSTDCGMRSIQHHVQNICSKVAYWVVSGKADVPVVINRSMLTPLLGRADKTYSMLNSEPEIGVINALTYISEGMGNVLPVEVGVLPGTGRMQYTGNLRKIIRESCEVVVSLIRSRAAEWDIDPRFYEIKDIHFHALNAGVPKEGPSMGAALFVALFSALLNKPIRNDLAMTGEMTLRGKIMPVGGLEEKITAAYNSGIKTVVIPAANMYEIPDWPDELVKQVEILGVSDVDELLEKTFGASK